VTPLLIALLILAAGTLIHYLLPQVAELGKAFMWSGAIATTLLLCRLIG
jgi:hypothetical protein